ncbi:MAG: hypothetical protein UU08_C0005G0030 [Candidatus Uhrbacteria bacterium GW2011_GWE2_40_58]|nr:MAG: hypothetical protein UT94_C0005G0030 [Candidatus Uhrbacteria bacterium GW2011_GWF2_40_263]KKR67980.1 MAG: hypothetical protein UU08_C0005G0030 [Candidatus Uhrbacteria bacterium GW2011_GWE2_40_58]OGL97016.1 MAG: hypothetical protein A2332_04070 [Candidatus Uhrbacteria bacterium RIFOXYB2_FULL_41_18]
MNDAVFVLTKKGFFSKLILVLSKGGCMNCSFKHIYFFLPDRLEAIAKQFSQDREGTADFDCKIASIVLSIALGLFAFFFLAGSAVFWFAGTEYHQVSYFFLFFFFFSCLLFYMVPFQSWLRTRKAVIVRGVKREQEELKRLKNPSRFAIWIVWMDTQIMNTFVRLCATIPVSDPDQLELELRLTGLLHEVDDHIQETMIVHAGMDFDTGEPVDLGEEAWKESLDKMEAWEDLLEKVKSMQKADEPLLGVSRKSCGVTKQKEISY